VIRRGAFLSPKRNDAKDSREIEGKVGRTVAESSQEGARRGGGGRKAPKNSLHDEMGSELSDPIRPP